MDSYPGDFPFGIMDVVELLHLRIRRRQANSVYLLWKISSRRDFNAYRQDTGLPGISEGY